MDELLNSSESRFDKQPSCLLEYSPSGLAHVQESKMLFIVKCFQWIEEVFRLWATSPSEDIHTKTENWDKLQRQQQQKILEKEPFNVLSFKHNYEFVIWYSLQYCVKSTYYKVNWDRWGGKSHSCLKSSPFTHTQGRAGWFDSFFFINTVAPCKHIRVSIIGHLSHWKLSGIHVIPIPTGMLECWQTKRYSWGQTVQ